jgi:zinc/manganese transport system substrate-binding protein
MRHGPRPLPALVALTLGLATCAACIGGPGPTTAQPAGSGSGAPIPVVGTENFYADLLTQVGGDRVQAASLLNDPNADPHEFETSPQDGVLVADARLVIVNGIGYDDFMTHLLDASPDPSRIVIDVQQVMGVADDANAHIWYDPATMPRVAQATATALSQLDPAHAADYATRAQAYVASLAPLGAKIAELKARYSGTPVAFTEPVAGYLAAAIGLDVLTPTGFQKAIEDGTDPAPADVAAERDLLTGKQVRVLLYNSQVASPITGQIHDLAVANGIPVVGVAETIPAGFQHYVDWQLAQLDALEAALAGGT